MNEITSIRHPVAVDAGLGRLRVETDYAAHVEQMMMQVLLTAPGERVNRPEFGCGVRRMVFAPNSVVSASLAQVSVVQALERWLGSVLTVEDVEVVPVEERLDIKIRYRIRALGEQRFLNVPLVP
jgi:phage baseplate assembly protein W